MTGGHHRRRSHSSNLIYKEKEKITTIIQIRGRLFKKRKRQSGIIKERVGRTGLEIRFLFRKDWTEQKENLRHLYRKGEGLRRYKRVYYEVKRK